jgi:putative adenylate-forming enzyme
LAGRVGIKMNLLRGLGDYLLLNKNFYKLNETEVKAMQEKLLFEAVNHALENSSFYRRSGIKSVTSMDDFYRFHIINKKIMMDNFNDINTCGLDLDEVKEFAVQKELAKDYTGYFKDEFVVGLSSGTSGNKGIYVTPKSLTQRLPFVFLARGGIPLYMLPFNILFLLRVFSQGFADIKAPLINLTYKSTMTDPNELVELVNREKINIIMAPPSMLRILMMHANEIKVKIKLVVSYAEVLEEEDKKKISNVFKTRVHEIYQASEGQIGSTCKCGNLHINEDLVFVELYDENNRPVVTPNIVARKMIITNLVNYAQPLIRYEMNDVIVLGEKCPCGSSFRVISKVIGRNDDVLVFRNSQGKEVSVFPDLFARWIITGYDRIREFIVTQHLDGKLSIEIDIPDISSGMNLNAPACLSEVDQTTRALADTISEHLKEFDIDCHPIVTIRAIPLPLNKSKFKRFERETCKE